MKIEFTDITLFKLMNIADDKVDTLYDKYVTEQFERFKINEVSIANCLMVIVNADELTTNEKCFACMMLFRESERLRLKEMIISYPISVLERELGAIP